MVGEFDSGEIAYRATTLMGDLVCVTFMTPEAISRTVENAPSSVIGISWALTGLLAAHGVIQVGKVLKAEQRFRGR